jgi:large subunit ribosomal protein L24
MARHCQIGKHSCVIKMKEFSKAWVSSKNPGKQRKYRYNAPLHIKQKFMRAHLSKELRQKYGKRSIGLKVGDKVKIMRGQFKGITGKVERVNIKKTRAFIGKAELIKNDGTKAMYPINPSNLMIIEINEGDKRRIQKSGEKKNGKKTPQKA